MSISSDDSAPIGAEQPATHRAHAAAGHAYRPEVDGLRALAVVPVILFHAGVEAFGGGYVGVDVFFVISGYLITSIILREQMSGRFSLSSFYERRARRILPALFLVMLATMPFAWIWMLPAELENYGFSLAAVSTFASNVLFWQTSGYFDGAAELRPLLHTWSLGVEEQYYVVFPIFIAIVMRFRRFSLAWLIAAGAALSLAVSIWLTTRNPSANFYLLPSRAWELLAGSLLATIAIAGNVSRVPAWVRHQFGVIGLVLILGPVFLYGAGTPFPGLAAVPPVLGTVLVLAFVDASSPVGRLLTQRIMLWIGAISYSAYLWHQPVFAFARLMYANEAPLRVYLALTLASLGLAHLSWRYVEAPFRDRTHFTRVQIFLGSAIGSALFIGAGAAIALSQGAPGRFAPAVMPFLVPAKTAIDGCPSENDVNVCRLGVPGVAPTIALVGDSHAYAIASSLDRSLKQLGRAGVLVHTRCHPIPGVFDSREPPTAARIAQCAAENAKLRAMVASPDIRDVIIAVRWTLRLYPMDGGAETPEFHNGEGGVESDAPYRRNVTVAADGVVSDAAAGKAAAVRDFIAGLSKGKRAAILYPVPEVGWLPARLNLISLVGDGAPPAEISTSSERFAQRNAAAIRVLDSVNLPDLRRSRPADILCNSLLAARCVVQARGTLFYSDDDHVSSAGADLIVADLLAKLGR